MKWLIYICFFILEAEGRHTAACRRPFPPPSPIFALKPLFFDISIIIYVIICILITNYAIFAT